MLYFSGKYSESDIQHDWIFKMKIEIKESWATASQDCLAIRADRVEFPGHMNDVQIKMEVITWQIVDGRWRHLRLPELVQDEILKTIRENNADPNKRRIIFGQWYYMTIDHWEELGNFLDVADEIRIRKQGKSFQAVYCDYENDHCKVAETGATINEALEKLQVRLNKEIS